MKWNVASEVWDVMREYEEVRRRVRETGFPEAPGRRAQAPEAVCRRCKRGLEPLEVNSARLCANCETALFGDV